MARLELAIEPARSLVGTRLVTTLDLLSQRLGGFNFKKCILFNGFFQRLSPTGLQIDRWVCRCPREYE